MFVFFLLVLCSLVTGFSLTYLFRLNLYFSERIIYGTVFSLSAFIQIIYLCSFYSGFKELNIFLIFSFISIFTIVLTRELIKRKEIIKFDFDIAFKNIKSIDKLHLPLIMLFWFIIFYLIFSKNLFVNEKGYWSNSSTDIPLHVAFITSFVWGDNFP